MRGFGNSIIMVKYYKFVEQNWNIIKSSNGCEVGGYRLERDFLQDSPVGQNLTLVGKAFRSAAIRRKILCMYNEVLNMISCRDKLWMLILILLFIPVIHL